MGCRCPRRLGVLIDWYRVLGSRRRAASASRRGASSTTPTAARPARSELSEARASTRPTDSTTARATTSCWRTSASRAIAIRRVTSTMRRSCQDPHGAKDQRQSACDLAFGTSTGALGFRKFPNPRFDADRWRALNGSMGIVERVHANAAGQRAPIRGPIACSTGRSSRRFSIGMSCGACHIAFNPLKPPTRSGTSAVGEHRRAGRQSVQPLLRDHRVGHVAQQPRVADLRARAAGHGRHVGGAERSGQQPGDDEPDHQPASSGRRSRNR